MVNVERVMPEWWLRRLWLMRICAPLCILWAACLIYVGLRFCQPIIVITNAALLVFEVYLTYVEWFVLQRAWPGRR
jgi:hypothetical protein